MTIEVVSPPGLFIVLTITKRAHYKAKSEATVRGGSSSTYPYIHITINTLQVELKNTWGATDLRNMKCVCSSAGITNTCHTTEESQAIVVTPPTGSLGFIRMLLLVNGAAPELPTPASMAY